MNTTIISDLHLGSDNCQAKAIHHFLDHLEKKTDRLILNGDVFDSMDFRRLKKHHWHVLSQLRKLSDKIEVVWVCGNHDGNAEVVSHLLGIEVYDEYELMSADKKGLILHGHIFDSFITKYPMLTWCADNIYRILQKIDRKHRIARMVKRGSKIYLRCTGKVRNKALKYAEERGFDFVCCGHVHFACDETTDGVQYLNSGCWTELPCHYIEIENGKAKVVEFKM